jgi:hypothetical protein
MHVQRWVSAIKRGTATRLNLRVGRSSVAGSGYASVAGIGATDTCLAPLGSACTSDGGVPLAFLSVGSLRSPRQVTNLQASYIGGCMDVLGCRTGV